MKGLSDNTSAVFNFMKEIDVLDDYFLIGGTALSLQIGHRLSEDLDFGKWTDDPTLKQKEVDWPKIEKALKGFGEVRTDVLDLNQVVFYLEGVKVEFYSNDLSRSREINSGMQIGQIRIADLFSIGIMKLEVMSRRNIFRDYYDIYAILQKGLSLKALVEGCGRYSKHRMKTKSILAILSDHTRFKYEEDFQLLSPVYNVNSAQIGEHIRQTISKEFSI